MQYTINLPGHQFYPRRSRVGLAGTQRRFAVVCVETTPGSRLPPRERRDGSKTKKTVVTTLTRLLRYLTLLLAVFATVPGALAAEPSVAMDPAGRLEVTDPYLEMHTGPGRGYPVFFVVTRGQGVWITLRHTDWYKVVNDHGIEGWVERSQLDTTLTAAGVQKPFRDLMLDDYLHRTVQLGAAWGEFKSEPLLKIWTSYRMSETLSLEATLGQVQGVFSGTTIWHLNIISEPWSDQRISPFFGLGMGKFNNLPNQSLVGALPTKAQLANATVGVRYYLTDRFMLRADYSMYTAFVSDQRSLEYRAASAGVSFFF